MFEPPRMVVPLFVAVALAMLARVVLPLVDNGHYTLWIGVSHVAWMAGFAVFSIVYIPQLTRPRLHGCPG